MTIGKCVSLNSTSITSFINSIAIGNYCSIAAGTKIIESIHIPDRITTYHYNKNILHGDLNQDIESKGDVVIEDDVWIGSNAVILSGVKIGRGAIVGAGSVVTHDIPAWTVVGGVPARVIKSRFDSEELITAIKATRWWEKTPEELAEERELFSKRGQEILTFLNS